MSDGVKHLWIKLILTLAILGAAVIVGRLLWIENIATDEGEIHLEILDQEGIVVFDEMLTYHEGDTFFDVLNRHFDLTCANQSYAADETCSYTFSSFAFEGKVILGISGEGFTLSSDWLNTFLAFYVKHEDAYVLSTLGPSQIPFEDQDEFRIVLESVWE